AVVRERQVNVEAALTEVIEKFTRAFAEIPNEYLRERATDIRDVGDRVLTALTREDRPSAVAFPEGSILVADELLPSTTARFELGRVRAFITDRGSKLSHTKPTGSATIAPSSASRFAAPSPPARNSTRSSSWPRNAFIRAAWSFACWTWAVTRRSRTFRNRPRVIRYSASGASGSC